MPRIPVVVDDSKKRRWSEFVEDNPEFDSVSDLVRKAVERQINGANNHDAISDQQITQVNANLDSVASRLTDLETQVKALRTETMTHSEYESFIHSDVRPIIDHIIEQQVEDVMWRWTEDNIIIPNIRKTGLTADYIRDLDKEQIIDIMEDK
ncbi:hypothetical protein SAMN04488691_105110 [Haloferax larsenii]|uniref:Uncharacterized protein n=2 Tax=Haloferax larsenii TaxID=302484 RepID=A0A1H7QPF1_HALLR|nr:hypothetical protein SAMN04488691_105110 [Haloferax larsenii]